MTSKQTQLDERAININQSMKFLYENEAVQETPLVNHLYVNIYQVSWIIRYVELIIDSPDKVISVYIKTNFLGKFKRIQRNLAIKIINGIQEQLPNYSVKIIMKEDRWKAELEYAKKKAKEPKIESIFNVMDKE